MKKFILSGIVIVFFVMFSLYYRSSNQPALPVMTKNESSTDTPTPTSSNVTSSTSNVPPTDSPSVANSGYKNGSYLGDAADAFYGNIQVQVAISDGKISDVQFLQYPNDRSRSIRINERAMPILKSEAIQAQSASVDIVSGATDSSQAFIQSLQSALAKART